MNKILLVSLLFMANSISAEVIKKNEYNPLKGLSKIYRQLNNAESSIRSLNTKEKIKFNDQNYAEMAQAANAWYKGRRAVYDCSKENNQKYAKKCEMLKKEFETVNTLIGELKKKQQDRFGKLPQEVEKAYKLITSNPEIRQAVKAILDAEEIVNKMKISEIKKMIDSVESHQQEDNEIEELLNLIVPGDKDTRREINDKYTEIEKAVKKN